VSGSGKPSRREGGPPTPDSITLAVDTGEGDDPIADLGTLLGRFVVVDRIGQGGMGTVLRAYDTKLCRNVALKLLRVGDDEEARSRIVREAQAMARLAHPNIVAVYDVGEHDGAPFIAMEFVDGVDLRQWLGAEPRASPAILRAFIDAGRGLAAAHRAGLVHRDFKPDNVLLGDDGRVRVTDFGLARGLDAIERAALGVSPTASASTLTVAGTVMGTLAYMAPEQHSGERVDERSDQYAYCVSLWEALCGKRPFGAEDIVDAKSTMRMESAEWPRGSPRFVRQVLLRGLAPRPEERWPTMDALLDALERGPSRRRLVAFAGVGVVALAGAWWGYDRWRRAEAQAECEAEAASIADVWSEEPRARVHRQFASLELSYAQATFDRVVPWIDRHVDAWQEHRLAVCVAERGLQAPAPHPGAAPCLAERRAELEALVEVLLAADADVVRRSVGAAARLASPSRCVDPTWLALWGPESDSPEGETVRQELAAVESKLGAGRLDEAKASAAAALASAEDVGDDALIVRARVIVGRTAQDRGDYEVARSELEIAYASAMAAGLDAYAFEAANLLTYLIGDVEAEHEAGLVWGQVATAIAKRIGAEDDPIVADLRNTIGGVYQNAGHHDEALTSYREALAITERTLGLDHPLAGRSQTNIATALQELGRYEESIAAFEVAIHTYETVLGPDSPELGVTLNNYGNALNSSGREAEALAVYERAISLYERAGVSDVRIAPLLYNTGNAHFHKGNTDRALPLYQRALEIWQAAHDDAHPHIAVGIAALAMTYSELGETDRAIEFAERALTIRQAAFGNEHAEVARSMNNLGSNYAQRGDYVRARELCEQASAMWARTLGPDHPDRAQAMINIANAQLWLGELDAAHANARAAVDLSTKALGEHHERSALAVQNLADVLLARGEVDAAVREYERAQSVMEKLSFAETGSRPASLWSGLGRARLEAGDLDGADAAFNRGRAAAAGLAEHSVLRAEIDFGLARTSAAQGQQRRALELAHRARATLEAAGAAGATRKTLVDTWLAEHE
jgi:tetratricopeptide (TPR) repeat protein/predicted Ser/Thr protein kinase